MGFIAPPSGMIANGFSDVHLFGSLKAA